MAGVSGIIERDPAAVFYGVSAAGSTSSLATDLSGYQSNLTHSTTWVYETNSSRAATTSRRSIEVETELNNTSTGYLYNHAGLSVLLVSGMTLRTTIGLTNLDLALSNAGAANRSTLVSVSMEPNPFTTSASDLNRYEILAYQPATGHVDRLVVSNIAPTGTVTDLVVGARTVAGSGAFTGLIFAVRIAHAFHSVEEWRRSWLP